MPITRIYPHYPKLNPTPPLKRRDSNSPFASTTLPKNDDILDGPPYKKLAVIETEPILADNFYTTAGPRDIQPSPSPRTKENTWSLINQLKLTCWGHSTVNICGDY
jgi:hypothetical protein